MKHHLVVGSSYAQVQEAFRTMNGFHRCNGLTVTVGETITMFRVAVSRDDSIRGHEFHDVRFLPGVKDRTQYLERRRLT